MFKISTHTHTEAHARTRRHMGMMVGSQLVPKFPTLPRDIYGTPGMPDLGPAQRKVLQGRDGKTGGGLGSPSLPRQCNPSVPRALCSRCHQPLMPPRPGWQSHCRRAAPLGTFHMPCEGTACPNPALSDVSVAVTCPDEPGTG